MEPVELLIKYGIYPLLALLCKLAYDMYKKLEIKIDNIEKRTNITEKEVIELRITTKKDIEHIKEGVDTIKRILTKNER